MLKPIITKDLSNGRGRVHINWDGMVWIQQGRPFGVMANPGEVFLNVEDLEMIDDMLEDFVATGHKILAPDVIRPL